MRKTGSENLVFKGESVGYRLSDFWSWAFSDLLDNTLRGSYAEFVVAAALGLDLNTVRVNWEPWDLTLGNIRIEVKSSSFLQSWEQEHLTNVSFSIRPTMQWTADGGYSGEVKRQSDVYVFCLYAEQDAAKADPADLDGWEFYVLPTRRLDENCGAQKTIAFGSMLRLGPIKTDFAGLKAAVQQSV